MTYQLIACLASAFIASAVSIIAQSHPDFSVSPNRTGGVYSRNMELIDILPRNIRNGDQFDAVQVPYETSSGTKYRTVLVSGYQSTGEEGHGGAICLRLSDVTNPRDPESDYIRVYVKGVTDGESLWANMGISKTYTHQGAQSESSFSGDVFLIVV